MDVECGSCGEETYISPGSDFVCADCGTLNNCFGQRLIDDTRLWDGGDYEIFDN